MGKQWKQWQILFSWDPKSVQMVTAAMKFKTLAFWKESYDKIRQHIKKQRHYFADKGPSRKSFDFSSSMDVRAGKERKLSAEELMLLNCDVREDSWESPGLAGRSSQIHPKRKSVLNIHWKDWCWSSNTLATWCKELTHWKRPWCWERLKAGGEGDDREWDVCMASPTQWTWVWVSSGSWWWKGKSGVLQSMWLQRVRHDWATELINK